MGFSRAAGTTERPATLALATAITVVAIVAFCPGVRAAGPSLTILSPANNAVIGNGTPVTVIFIVSDFNLTAPGTGGPGPTPNEGYVEVHVDGNLTGVVDQETIMLPLPSGTYNITLRLVLANGTYLTPDVRASVAVTVTQGPAVGTPRIEVSYVDITYPTPGVVLDADVTISFRVTDFALVPPAPPSYIPNEGHVAVLVDGVYNKAVTTFEPVPFSDLTDGVHTITFQLVDNLGRPLTPDASASITVEILSNPVVDISPYLLGAQFFLAFAILVVLFYPRRERGALRSARVATGRPKP